MHTYLELSQELFLPLTLDGKFGEEHRVACEYQAELGGGELVARLLEPCNTQFIPQHVAVMENCALFN